jgi:hypothetical protein
MIKVLIMINYAPTRVSKFKRIYKNFSLSYIFFVFFIGSIQTCDAQKKIINFDFQTNNLDREYLYYQEPFIISGKSKFGTWTFDSIQLSICKTEKNDILRINQVPKLNSKICISSTPKDGFCIQELIQKADYKYYLKLRTPNGESDRLLTQEEKKKWSKEIQDNSVMQDEIVYSSTWYREGKEDGFSMAINSYLLFTWTYVLKFDFYYNDPERHTSERISKIVYIRAYDEETVASHFAITTGLGGLYLGNSNKSDSKEFKFLNYLAVKYHFVRIFPTKDNPFLFGFKSRLNVSLGFVTTAINYMNKPVEGFGSNVNFKPVLSFGCDFNKFAGISLGIIGFNQRSSISTSSNQHFAIAPFLTLNVSADIINLYNSSGKPPKGNEN